MQPRCGPRELRFATLCPERGHKSGRMIGRLQRRRLTRISHIGFSILCCGRTLRHRKRATRVMQRAITPPGCYSRRRCRMIRSHIRLRICWQNLKPGCPSIQRDKKGVRNYGRKFGDRSRKLSWTGEFNEVEFWCEIDNLLSIGGVVSYSDDPV